MLVESEDIVERGGKEGAEAVVSELATEIEGADGGWIVGRRTSLTEVVDGESDDDRLLPVVMEPEAVPSS